LNTANLIKTLRNQGFEIKATNDYLDISPADRVSRDVLAELKTNKKRIIQELQAEKRRLNVFDKLNQDPNLKRALLVDCESDAKNVIIAIAIRDLGSCEMIIPKSRFDSWKFLEFCNLNFSDAIH
jgi:DNA-binding transcriptional MerR regulator